eukprot:TRINITY_DN15123_c0_g1_i2.p2 TRINITY_DN15123_c0_g1~~TRINITY_DN15123_c0_g1_i2.p2  ORF type:complete len:180 (-),score=53.34 TRINITY_DN15123_c0_g1_i2:317-856(-)
MIRRPPRSTLSSSSAASDVYKRQEKESFVSAANKWVPELRANVAKEDGFGRRLPIVMLVGTKADKRADVIGAKAEGGHTEESSEPVTRPVTYKSDDGPDQDEPAPVVPGEEKSLQDLVLTDDGYDAAYNMGAYGYTEVDAYDADLVKQLMEDCIMILSDPKAKPLKRRKGSSMCQCSIL